jgi:L-alanine-DL-glutamate epimerase-like enolase superfamily enzyme
VVAHIVKLEASAWDIELHEPFGIATGAQEIAANVLVRVELDDGTVGLGEAAPFPAVSGETQEQALTVLQALTPLALGHDIADWGDLADIAGEHCGDAKSALGAFETALLDAHCKQGGQSLCTWAGGKESALQTDVTLPTGSVEAARQAARARAAQGFGTLKIKVGGAALEHDVQRLHAVLAAAPEAALLLDGNAALSVDDALTLVAELGDQKQRVQLFEQPTPAHDLQALAEVQSKTGIPVAADESARSLLDVERLFRTQGIAAINLKIMKSGLVEALAMAHVAKRLGFALMIGGMVETDLAMSASASLAAGTGGFRWVDLDTPLFMKGAPTRGGVRRSGSRIDIDTSRPGHGAFVA